MTENHIDIIEFLRGTECTECDNLSYNQNLRGFCSWEDSIFSWEDVAEIDTRGADAITDFESRGFVYFHSEDELLDSLVHKTVEACAKTYPHYFDHPYEQQQNACNIDWFKRGYERIHAPTFSQIFPLLIVDKDREHFVIKLQNENPSELAFIDAALWNRYADMVVEKLQRKSKFKIKIITMRNYEHKVIALSTTIVHAFGSEDLKYYVLQNYGYNCFQEDSFSCNTLGLPDNHPFVINIPHEVTQYINTEELPRHIEIESLFVSEVVGPLLSQDDYTYTDTLKYQIIVMPDNSIVLQPFPNNIITVFEKQYDMISKEHYRGIVFIHKMFYQYVKYLMDNNLRLNDKKITRIYSEKETFEMAKEANKEHRNIYDDIDVIGIELS